MVITNKLDKSFGPQMVFPGYLMMGIGLMFIFDIMGFFLFLAGFVLVTTNDFVSIDTQKRTVGKFSGPFGLRLFGKWEELDNYEGITLVPIKTRQVILSRSNKQHSTEQDDYRIFLVGHDHKPTYAIYKNSLKENAQKEMEKLADVLHWKVWTIDKL